MPKKQSGSGGKGNKAAGRKRRKPSHQRYNLRNNYKPGSAKRRINGRWVSRRRVA